MNGGGFESALSLFSGGLSALTSPSGFGVAAWVLAIVFAWSGTAKLRQPSLAAMAMSDFGVVRGIRPRLGSALGAGEVGLAVLLAVGAVPVLVVPATAALLWFFVVLIGRSLGSGKTFACFCFGDADSKLSGTTLVRTGALALLATVLAFSSVFSPSPGALYVGFGGVYVLQAVAAAALVSLVVLGSQVPKILRGNGDLARYTTNTEVNR